MTTARRGGGVRALGASLLDQVLAETLDPAYQQAADARTAGGVVPAPNRRRGRSAVLAAVTLLVTGLLLAVAYNQAAARSPGREEVRAALIADIQRESASGDRLAAQLEELGVEVDRTRDRLLDSTDEGQRALDDLAEAEAGAAAVGVSGPGLLVTLADAEPEADSDPVGGEVVVDPRGQVGDHDLQLVVNALWGAGAEAISINDQRLGPTSAIRFAGEAVLVDFEPVTNPYEIRAIGDPDALSAGFLGNVHVRGLAGISRTFGLRFDYAREDDLTLPAANPAELRAAEPADDEGDSGASGTGSSSVPSGTPDDEPEAAP